MQSSQSHRATVIGIDLRTGMVKLDLNGEEKALQLAGLYGSSADHPEEGDRVFVSLEEDGTPVAARFERRAPEPRA